MDDGWLANGRFLRARPGATDDTSPSGLSPARSKERIPPGLAALATVEAIAGTGPVKRQWGRRATGQVCQARVREDLI